MRDTVSATEARIHFGELMRRADEGGETIVVERGGRPTVVVLSVEAHARLLAQASDATALGREPVSGAALGIGEATAEYRVAAPEQGDHAGDAALAAILAERLPVEILDRLRRFAAYNRRSVGGEALYRVEQSLRPRRVPAAEIIRRIEKIHEGIKGPPFTLDEIEAAINEGRP